MAIQDQIDQLTREVWRLNLSLGLQQRVGWHEGEIWGRLAKASGVTEPMVMSWLAGESQPATGQALAFLSALPYPAVSAAAMNGAAK